MRSGTRARHAVTIAAVLAACWADAEARGQMEIFAPETISTTETDDLTPTFSPDGERLVFVRRAEGGPFTLHESRRMDRGWSEPVALPFSGRWDDQAPFFAPDGKRLFFQSRRPADPSRTRAEDAPRDDDLWVVEVVGGGWGTPRPIGPPVRKSPPADGEPFEGREMAPAIDREGVLYYWSHVPATRRAPATSTGRSPRTGDGARPRDWGHPSTVRTTRPTRGSPPTARSCFSPATAARTRSAVRTST